MGDYKSRKRGVQFDVASEVQFPLAVDILCTYAEVIAAGRRVPRLLCNPPRRQGGAVRV